ncbi:MAG: T9SS type A sorting domain-containing protein [Bacteroidales bacterium]|nr:T9SS type A sorting domain-containing protein [Bacteroidales bacterium]
MKKLFTLFILTILAFSINGLAQTAERCIPELLENSGFVKGKDLIGDFTITDTEGNVLNLYEKLDEGKTVFIDLFYVDCGYCQLYAPIIEQIYQNTGAGQGDVLMWGLSPYDNNAYIDSYKLQYGISNPCAGTEGNGPAAKDVVIAGQNFLGYPTYCVVCSDRTLYFDPCYPPTVNGFNTYFDNCAATVLIADFVSDVTELCIDSDVVFEDLSLGNIVSWAWNFEGGNPPISTEQNPTVNYSTAGIFDVGLIISNGTNYDTVQMDDYITVNDLPVVTLDPFDDVCEYDPAFELSGGLPVGGVYSGTGVNNGWFDPGVAGVGTHSITYTYNDSNGCENFAEETILVDICSGLFNPEAQNISIFPNPVRDILTITSTQENPGIINIYTLTGRLAIQISPGIAKSYHLDVSELSEGLYIIEIKGNKSVYRDKIKIIR